MKKKSIALTLTAVMLALAVGIGGTIAYFTSTTENVQNTFTTGKVGITLDEAKVTKNGDTWTAGNERVKENKYETVYPGAVLPKDPTIHVNTDSQEAYVAMKVVVTKANEWKTALAAKNIPLADVVKGHDEAKWARVGDPMFDTTNDTVTYFYMYKTTVKAGDNCMLFNQVIIPAAFDNDELAKIDGFTMTATGYAIQAQGVNEQTAKAGLVELAGLN